MNLKEYRKYLEDQLEDLKTHLEELKGHIEMVEKLWKDGNQFKEFTLKTYYDRKADLETRIRDLQKKLERTRNNENTRKERTTQAD